MPYKDPTYIQKKIELIEKGLPIDIAETELAELENVFRGARSFYVDMLINLLDRRKTGEDVEQAVVEESKNVANIEVSLRRIDDFRKHHWNKIKGQE